MSIRLTCYVAKHEKMPRGRRTVGNFGFIVYLKFGFINTKIPVDLNKQLCTCFHSSTS